LVDEKSAPQHGFQFLRWFCREDSLEGIEGDLTNAKYFEIIK